jgi:NTP pyrophosphatase (non-canonical NTP hydrolase)
MNERIIDRFEQSVDVLFVNKSQSVEGLAHAALGIAGEAGEIVDAVKKTWIYDKALDLENVKEEAGDLLFYLVAIGKLCGFSLEDAMRYNMAKLAKRYPSGYTNEAAIARADKQEEVNAELAA